MICPKCNRENEADNRFCIHCGETLPDTAPNQVWNTDIDREKNQKNSRSALIVLCISLVLLLGLVIALFATAPSMGDILIGPREEGQSFFGRVADFLDIMTDSLSFGTPTPEAYASIPDGADKDFVKLFEEYMEKVFDDGYVDSRRLSERYYEEFDSLKYEHFTDGNLAAAAARTAHALDLLRKGSLLSEELEDPSVTHQLLWLEGSVELYTLAEELHNRYGVLYKEPEITEQCIWLRPVYDAHLEVERDLASQLMIGEIGNPNTPPVFQYTNHTPYELDLTFYIDYETEADFTFDQQTFARVAPEETIVIRSDSMPADCIKYYIAWSLDSCYYDGTDVYSYFW
jgi:hypothetical protein